MFAKRVESTFKGRGLLVSEAARRCGMKYAHFSRYVNGTNDDPRLGTLARIAAGLETNMSYLVGEADDPAPRTNNIDTFGSRVMQLRKAQAMSRHGLGREVETSGEHIKLIETGARQPKRILAVCLAIKLDTSFAFLVGEVDAPAPAG